ncbi:hypothetical protein EVAR_88935_1 [Eumeta japonica]|uniref:PiggyBac transposable element-derived protein domain-containing protein n=1 Tax=Eumeta variegata TaxID=151549 RepID=A0A4C1VSS8_EUMVA|nr:hypothetical protein EVAR_88935_1 [Eumeta japonica]
MINGSGVENLYQPKLWYYKELEFLNDPVQSTPSISTIESDNDGGENRSQVSSQDSLDNISSPPPSVNSVLQLPSQTPSPSSTPELPSFPRKRKDDTSNQMFRLITQRLSQQEDDFDIFDRIVANDDDDDDDDHSQPPTLQLPTHRRVSPVCEIESSSHQDFEETGPPSLSSDSVSTWTPAGEMKNLEFSERNVFLGPHNGDPVDYFNFFFDDAFLQFICQKSNEQAAKLLLSENTKEQSRITGGKT